MRRTSIIAAALAVMVAGAGLTGFGSDASAAPLPIHKQAGAQPGEASPLLEEAGSRRWVRRGWDGGRGWGNRGWRNRGWAGRNWRYDRWRYGPRYRYRYGPYRYFYRGYYYGWPWWYGGLYYGAPHAYSYYDGYDDGYDSAHVRWCKRKYRSYRVRSNTYLSNSGYRRRCISPYSY